MAQSRRRQTYPVQPYNDDEIQLLHCQLLDPGYCLSIHVYNDSSRFKPTHTTISEDDLVSGSTKYNIEAYGTVEITNTTPTGSKRNTTLQQVPLLPSSFTNLMSFSKTIDARIYWDTRKATLFPLEHGIQNEFCSLRPHNGH